MNSVLKKLNQFKLISTNITQSKGSILIAVLITSTLIPLMVNLLFKSEKFKSLMKNQFYFVLIGLLIYGVWLAFLFFLYKKDSIQLKDLTITQQKLKSGLLAGFYLFIGANILLLAFLLINKKEVAISEDFISIGLAAKAFSLFIFNILIGAFIEEITFRAYLIPQVFIRIKNKVNNSSISLIITILITQAVFACAHIPSYIIRFHSDFHSIISKIIPLIISGIIFSLIFLRTKNIFFVMIFHAFCNFTLPLFNSPYFSSYSNIVVLIIALLWYIVIEPKRKENEMVTTAAYISS